jgi:hypothetical protein
MTPKFLIELEKLLILLAGLIGSVAKLRHEAAKPKQRLIS